MEQEDDIQQDDFRELNMIYEAIKKLRKDNKLLPGDDRKLSQEYEQHVKKVVNRTNS